MIYKGVEIKVSVSRGGALPQIETEAEAPKGKVFVNSSTHFVYWYDNEKDAAARKRAVEPIKRDIDGGFEDCTNPDCEICGDAELV